jgi:acyl dehydratase
VSPTREQLAGVRLEPLEELVERGRVRFFARTIGERGTVFDDLEVARAAGHPDLVVPPTYFFTLENEREDPIGDLAPLGVDQAAILHGEQAFEYLALVHAGDTVRVTSAFTDTYEKGGGRLLFLVRETRFERDGELVARATATLVVPR